MDHLQLQSAFKFVAISRFGDGGQLMTVANLCLEAVGVFHNRNPSNLDSSDQRIRLFCDLNLNLDYESVDLPLEVDQQIQCPWITHNSLKNNCSNMWQDILIFGKFYFYCDIIILQYCILIYINIWYLCLFMLCFKFGFRSTENCISQI